jgi:hypothetical protein
MLSPQLENATLKETVLVLEEGVNAGEHPDVAETP